MTAARRGGDSSQRMDGEGLPEEADLSQALYWVQIYAEILVMERAVLARIRRLMLTQSSEVQREVELTNVPVVAAQVEKCRERHGYWLARVSELHENGSTSKR